MFGNWSAVIALAQTLPAVLVAMVAIGLATGVLNTYLLSWVQRACSRR